MNLTLRYCLIICLLSCRATFAQNCLDIINNSESYENKDDIINGTKWIYEKKYLGSPLLVENYWPRADILYGGVLYKGVLMNYDVYKNDVIIFHPEIGNEKYVVITKDYLAGFSFTDSLTKKKHQYNYSEIPCTSGKALYETLVFRKTILYIKPDKNISGRLTGGQGEFIGYSTYYLQTGSVCSNFRSKNQLIQLLETPGNELARFIRRNKIKFDKANPDNIIAILSYYDELNE